MWQASVGHEKKLKDIEKPKDDDDWDTDANFVNDVDEKEIRWGSKGVEDSGRDPNKVNMQDLIHSVTSSHSDSLKKEYDGKPNFSTGYGGKFGVQTDRFDKPVTTPRHIIRLLKKAI